MMFGLFGREKQDEVPVETIQPDWTDVFSGDSIKWSAIAPCIKDLHLRVLVLEGELERERALRKLHEEKLAVGVAGKSPPP